MTAKRNKWMLRFIVPLLSFALIMYGFIFWLSLQFDEEVREYPWWEDYADYWVGDWIRLSSHAHKNGYEPKENVDCTIVAQAKTWGITTTEIHFCFEGQKISIDELLAQPIGQLKTKRYTWKRYGLFGILTGYKSWDGGKYTYNKDLNTGLFLWFPNGPFSLLTPHAAKPNKIIIEKLLTNAEIVDAFIKVTTELEYDPYGNEQRFKPIRKRTAPVRLIVDDFSKGALFDGKTVAQRVDELLLELSALTGLDMKRIERGTEPENAVVAFLYENQRDAFLEFFTQTQADQQKRQVDTGYFMSLEEIKNRLYRKDSRCFGTTLSGPQADEIISDNNIIFLEKSGHVPGCIHEEIIQGLGLMNDVRELEPTIFNDYSPHRFATLLDKILIQLLYDSRIKPGMNAKEVWPILETIVNEYREQGKLNQLTKRVYKP